MTSPRTTSGDLPIALGLLTAGVAAAVIASRQSPAAFHFIPSMDGCLTAGCVGFILALVAGAPYRQALSMLLPIVGIQMIGARVHDASLLASLGIDALVFGLIGTALALRARPATPAPAPLPRRRHHPMARPRPAPAH